MATNSFSHLPDPAWVQGPEANAAPATWAELRDEALCSLQFTGAYRAPEERKGHVLGWLRQAIDELEEAYKLAEEEL
jgi:hypothetical protein